MLKTFFICTCCGVDGYTGPFHAVMRLPDYRASLLPVADKLSNRLSCITGNKIGVKRDNRKPNH